MTMLKSAVHTLSLIALLQGCGGGGGGSDDNGEGQQTVLSSLVPKGVPVLYVHSTLQVGGGSDLVTRTVRQFVPATQESIIIDIDDSFSFARSATSIKTFDDTPVLLRNTGSSGFSGGAWLVLDTDAQVDKSEGQEFQPALAAVNTSEGGPLDSCIAASDQSIYWRNASAAVMRATYSSAGLEQEQELIASTSSDQCLAQVFTIDNLNRSIGGMDFADGQFYDVQYDGANGIMDFFSRDLATAAPTLLANLTMTDHAAYNPGYAIGFDNGQAYFARVATASSQLEIWSFDFTTLPQLMLSASIDGINLASVSGLDVDDGYFVMRLLEQGATAFDSTNILLFDSNSMSSLVIDLLVINPATPTLLPPTFADVEIIYRQP